MLSGLCCCKGCSGQLCLALHAHPLSNSVRASTPAACGSALERVWAEAAAAAHRQQQLERPCAASRLPSAGSTPARSSAAPHPASSMQKSDRHTSISKAFTWRLSAFSCLLLLALTPSAAVHRTPQETKLFLPNSEGRQILQWYRQPTCSHIHIMSRRDMPHTETEAA